MAFTADGAIPWPVPADWASPVRETLAWLTDYTSARNGKRQKRQLRLAPRRTFEFNVVGEGDDPLFDRRLLDALRFDRGAAPWALPVFPDVQYLSAALDAASSSVTCATAGRDFVAGGSALLWLAANQWELLSIDTVSADGLALSTPTAAAWPAGSRLYPLRQARASKSVQESLWTDAAGQLKVSLLVDEPCDFAAVAPAASYRSLPVLEWRPDEADAPTNQYDRATRTTDVDTGVIDYVDLPGRPFRAQSHNFTLFGRDDHTAFRSLVYWLRGRMGTLWVPSFAADLQLASDASAAATTLAVTWCGYTLFGRQQSNRRDLRIELQDGTVLYRRIIASVDAGDTETLTLDSALGVAVPVAGLRAISFMTLSEAASDTVTIDHATDADGVATATLSWAGIIHDL